MISTDSIIADGINNLSADNASFVFEKYFEGPWAESYQNETWYLDYPLVGKLSGKCGRFDVELLKKCVALGLRADTVLEKSKISAFEHWIKCTLNCFKYIYEGKHIIEELFSIFWNNGGEQMDLQMIKIVLNKEMFENIKNYFNLEDRAYSYESRALLIDTFAHMSKNVCEYIEEFMDWDSYKPTHWEESENSSSPDDFARDAICHLREISEHLSLSKKKRLNKHN